MKKTPIIVFLLFFSVSSAMGGSVTVAWDANTEETLQGYKIYYGRLSRFETVGAIQTWCTAHEPNNDKCVEEWEAICTDRNAYGPETTDPACHQMLFDYEKVVDVKKVTEYTITNLTPGVTYYLAATGYIDPDIPQKESAFSMELKHFMPVIAPAQPQVLRIKIAPPYDLEIIDESRSDSIKINLDDFKDK